MAAAKVNGWVDADGKPVPNATAQPEQKPAEGPLRSDELMTDAEAASFSEVFEGTGLTQADLDAGIATAPSAITSGGTMEDVSNTIARRTGADPAAVQPMIEQALARAGASFDRTLKAAGLVGREDFDAFYAEMKQRNPEKFAAALSEALMAGKVGTLKSLAADYLRTAVMNEADLRATGITKTFVDPDTGDLMAEVGGRWWPAKMLRRPR